MKTIQHKNPDGTIVGVRLGSFVTIGNDVKIGNGVTIGNFVRLGSFVTIGRGVKIGDGVTIGNFVRLGSFVTIGNDVTIGNGVKIGNFVRLGRGESIPTKRDIISIFSGKFSFGINVCSKMVHIGCQSKTRAEWLAVSIDDAEILGLPRDEFADLAILLPVLFAMVKEVK